jgi:hypothetical protein
MHQKANVVSTIEPPILMNPFTWLWIMLSTSKVLWNILLNYFKLAKIVIVQVFMSIEDEQTFSILYFIQFKLQNRFNEHLPVVVNMYFQTLFTLENFLYDATFENCQRWKVGGQSLMGHQMIFFPHVVFLPRNLYFFTFSHFVYPFWKD